MNVYKKYTSGRQGTDARKLEEVSQSTIIALWLIAFRGIV